MSEKEYKKYDTKANTTYHVRLAMDPRVYVNEDGSHNTVLTFIDTSRFDNLEELWVDARLAKYQTDRGKRLRKGDSVMVEGKLRFKKNADGSLRGKIYDASFSTLESLKDREEIEPEAVSFE